MCHTQYLGWLTWCLWEFYPPNKSLETIGKKHQIKKSFKVFALSTKRWDEYFFASFDLWKLSYFCQFLSKRNQFRMLFGSKEIKGRTNWIALLSYCYHCELHCVSNMACHAQVVFLFYQLQFLCTCKIQNALWMIAIFIFQIQYAALSLNPLTFYLCLCDKLVVFFLPKGHLFLSGASASIRIKFTRMFFFFFFSFIPYCISSK